MKKLAGCLILILALALQAATYSLVDLGSLDDGINPFDPETTINAINLSGRVVGIATSNNVAYSSFIYGGARTNLGTLGGAACYALGINNSNIVCGRALTTNGATRAFRWTPGATNGVATNPQMTDLGTLSGYTDSEASDINAAGQIVGECWGHASGAVHAVRFNTNNTVTDIGALLPGSITYSYAWGINPAGHVVGSTTDASGNNPQAFLYTNGSNVKLLGDLTGPNGKGDSEAYAISASGQVVGVAVNANSDFHAFRWLTNGSRFDLGTLGGTYSSAWSINSNNVVVGTSTLIGDLDEHAFVTTSNTLVDLNTQLDAGSNNWVLIKAEYINDFGQIVGYGTTNGVRRGFLLTPKWPVITNPPASLIVAAGSNVVFTVGVMGSAPFAYQWRFNGTNLSGANADSLAVSNVQLTNTGGYDVVVTNDFGIATSAVATLILNVPVITNQPVSQVVLATSNVTFRVDASGAAPLAYQWRLNGVSLAAANTNLLTIANAQATNAGGYDVIITNSSGTATSSVATLTVNYPVAITNQPASLVVFAGSNAMFAVGAGGTAPLGYQWRFNGTNLAGASAASLTVSNAQSANAGNYAVVVTNNFSALTSAVATLTVISNPVVGGPVIIGSNSLISFATAAGATYYLETSSNLLSGNWSNVASGIAGTGSLKTITNFGVSATPARFYRIRVTVP